MTANSPNSSDCMDLDLNTPEDVGVVDVGTNTATDFSESQLQDIHAWKNYGSQIVHYTSDLLQKGSTDLLWPIKPKSNLNNLFNNGAVTHKSKLEGTELHNYLKSKLVENQQNKAVPDSSNPTIETSTLEEILPALKDGYECVNKAQGEIMNVYFDYGEWLQIAYKKFEHEKRMKRINLGWDKWLVENVGISRSFAGKLRTIAKMLGAYSNLRKLGITLTELYELRTQILEMMMDDECEKFWIG
jgi:hypothetical protein